MTPPQASPIRPSSGTKLDRWSCQPAAGFGNAVGVKDLGCARPVLNRLPDGGRQRRRAAENAFQSLRLRRFRGFESELPQRRNRRHESDFMLVEKSAKTHDQRRAGTERPQKDPDPKARGIDSCRSVHVQNGWGVDKAFGGMNPSQVFHEGSSNGHEANDACAQRPLVVRSSPT